MFLSPSIAVGLICIFIHLFTEQTKTFRVLPTAERLQVQQLSVFATKGYTRYKAPVLPRFFQTLKKFKVLTFLILQSKPLLLVLLMIQWYQRYPSQKDNVDIMTKVGIAVTRDDIRLTKITTKPRFETANHELIPKATKMKRIPTCKQ